MTVGCRPHLKPLVVADADLAEIDRILCEDQLPPRLQKRALCLLLLSREEPIDEICRQTGLVKGSVYSIRHRYEDRGMKVLEKPAQPPTTADSDRWSAQHLKTRGSRLRRIQSDELTALIEISAQDDAGEPKRRAQIIIDIHSGIKAIIVAQRLGVSRQAISEKVSKFNLFGLSWVLA
ncbi:helix-turn-helix domain-containing protein [candidate division WWE3 bacterium]|nr:helix-turn-helix domain-containing protein [candidate division WWE3 bacterium]